MGEKLDRRTFRVNIRNEEGYLLISTLFFLLFSSIFTASMIRISGNQILQYNQLTIAYESKAALNMAENLLLEYVNEHGPVKEGSVQTSIGEINLSVVDESKGITYLLTLEGDTGYNYSKEILYVIEPFLEEGNLGIDEE